MSEVVSFEDYRPAARFDNIPWTQAEIEEADSVSGPWTVIDTISLGTPDADPTEPAVRSFTTNNGTGPDLWYRVSFLDGSSNRSLPTVPVQNTALAVFPWAEPTELFRILKIRQPSDDQVTAADRVLKAAAGEIRAEIDLADDDTLADWEEDLCAQVNLDRAADLWRHTESIPGVTGLLGDEGVGTPFVRYSWERYAQRLAPVKKQWGLA